ncbi:MAG: hypothetical protein ACRERS_11290, partial [Methylococcales bacterium]
YSPQRQSKIGILDFPPASWFPKSDRFLALLCCHVRNVSRAVSDFLHRQFNENIPPLRLTVHAGEEFIHLLGGLGRTKSRW